MPFAFTGGTGRAGRKLHRARRTGFLRHFCLLLLLLLAPVAAAAPLARISEIVFEGNKVTLPVVMRREMVIREGDPADPEKIERSRQAIQNLGLFRSVKVEQSETPEGVRLKIVVTEKYYLLPYPRLSTNTDGQYGYGAELRWNNIGGRNQSLRALVSRAELKEEGRGVRTSFRAMYRAPFVFDSPYTLNLSAEHVLAPVTDPLPYDETFNEGEVLVSRNFPPEGAPASEGFSLGGGLLWKNEDRSGPGVPEPYGSAIAAVVEAGYRDVRFKIYSEEGTVAKLRLEAASSSLGSDYSYSQITGDYRTYFAIGSRAHEGVELGFNGGILIAGPEEVNPFKLGGSEQLHAYERNFLEGDDYYLFRAQYLRPLGWDWLRGGVVLEAGNCWSGEEGSAGRIYTSVGLGFRARLTWFVNFELEAGIAVPLEGGSPRFYAGKV